MQGAGSIYFATLQGYVINETELYIIGIYPRSQVSVLYTQWPPFLQMLHIKFGYGQVVSVEMMFEYYGNIHVKCPREGANEPLDSFLFHNNNYSV